MKLPFSPFVLLADQVAPIDQQTIVLVATVILAILDLARSLLKK